MSIFNSPRHNGKSTYIAKQAIILMQECYENRDNKPPVIIVPRYANVGSMRLILDKLNKKVSDDIIIETADELTQKPHKFNGKVLLIDEAQECLKVIASHISGGLVEATMTVRNVMIGERL